MRIQVGLDTINWPRLRTNALGKMERQADVDDVHLPEPRCGSGILKADFRRHERDRVLRPNSDAHRQAGIVGPGRSQSEHLGRRYVDDRISR